MKNKLLIIVLCLFTFTGIKNANAQTKEETIDWLKEYLRSEGKITPAQYSEFDGFYLSYIDECGFELKVRHQSGSMHLFVVPLNGMEIKYNGELKFSGDKIKWINLGQESHSYLDESMFFRFESINGGYDQIRNRFERLATFCSE